MNRIDILKRKLREHNLDLRLDAITELTTIRDDAAIDALEIALSDMTIVDQKRHIRVCDLAAEGLANINTPRAQAVVEDWWRDPIPFIVKAIQSEEDVFLIPALQALETMPVDNCRVRALLVLFDSYDEDLRDRARIEIKKLGSQAVTPLIQLLAPDNTLSTRKHAAYILGELRTMEAVPVLLEMLNDEVTILRANSAYVLGNIGDPAAVPELIARLSDIMIVSGSMNHPVHDSAASALEQIGTAEAMMAVESWRKNPALFFIDALHSPLVALRRKQAWTLYQYRQQRVIEALIEALDDPDSEVRRGAAWSLGQIGDRDAVKPLLDMLPSSSCVVCATVILALGSLRATEAIPVLTQNLTDTRIYHHNQRICDAAADALHKIKQK